MENQSNIFKSFTLRSLLLWYVLFFGAYLVLNYAMPQVIDALDSETFPFLQSGFIAVDIAWLWYYSKKAGLTFRDLIGTTYFTWRHLGYLVLAIPLLTASVSFLVILSYYLPVINDFAPPEIPVVTSFEKIGTFLILVVFAPIVEEILFRKVLLHSWSNKWRIGTSLVLTSILFCLLHFDILGALLFGIVLSLLYVRTKNLIPSIIIHALNNLWVFIIMILPTSGSSENTSISSSEITIFFVVLGIDLIWIGLTLYIFRPKVWELPEPNTPKIPGATMA